MNNNKNCFFRVGIDRRKDEVLLKSFNDYNHIDLKLGDLTLESPFKMRVSEGTKFYERLQNLKYLEILKHHKTSFLQKLSS